MIVNVQLTTSVMRHWLDVFYMFDWLHWCTCNLTPTQAERNYGLKLNINIKQEEMRFAGKRTLVNMLGDSVGVIVRWRH